MHHLSSREHPDTATTNMAALINHPTYSSNVSSFAGKPNGHFALPKAFSFLRKQETNPNRKNQLLFNDVSIIGNFLGNRTTKRANELPHSVPQPSRLRIRIWSLLERSTNSPSNMMTTSSFACSRISLSQALMLS